MRYRELLFRGLKTAIAAVSAVIISTLFDLQFEAAAGIIAILSVGDTKRLTIDIILRRIGSTLLALVIAAVMFHYLGFNLMAYGIYLAIYVPAAFALGLQVGLGPCSVLVTHLLAVESIELSMMVNEVGLMVIGSGTAFLVNMFMLSYERKIKLLKDQINDEIKCLMMIFDDSLCSKKQVEDDHFAKVTALIHEALEVCKTEIDNHIFQTSEYDYNYILMRQSQVQILDKMQELVNLLSYQTEECLFVGDLFQQSAENIDKMTPNNWIIDDTQDQINAFKRSLLKGETEDPATTALLFAILNLFEELLTDKRDFYYRFQGEHHLLEDN